MKRFLIPSASAPALKRSNSTNSGSKQGNVSAKERANTFSSDFYCNDGKLFCRACNVVVDHIRKSTIVDHLSSQSHKRRKGENIDLANKNHLKLQTIESTLNARTIADANRKISYTNLVEAFVKSNIPLHALDNSALRGYLTSHIEGLGSLPSSDRLRRDYLPSVKVLHEQQLMNMFAKSDAFIISSDESPAKYSDDKLFNILITPINISIPTDKQISFLAEQAVLKKANSYTVSAAITGVIAKYNIDNDKVIGYTSDNAIYMQKSFETLRGIYPKCTYVTCTAHLFNLIFERVMTCNMEVENFIHGWQTLFSTQGYRKERYFDFLSEKGIDNTNPRKNCPKHNSTRWTTWLEALLWHGERIDYAKQFLQLEKEHTESGRVERLLSILDEDFESKIKYLSEVSVRLIKEMSSIQSNSLIGHHLRSKLDDLQSYFHAEMEKCSAENSLHLMWNEMLTKFYQYFAWCSIDKEPNQRPKYCQVALPLFLRTPFLDPSQAKFLNVKQEVLAALPLLSEAPADQTLAYISDLKNIDPDNVQCFEYWKSKANRWPELSKAAIMTLSIPCTNVEPERSFSSYTRIATPYRANLLGETTEMLNMLHFNSKL